MTEPANSSSGMERVTQAVVETRVPLRDDRWLTLRLIEHVPGAVIWAIRIWTIVQTGTGEARTPAPDCLILLPSGIEAFIPALEEFLATAQYEARHGQGPLADVMSAR